MSKFVKKAMAAGVCAAVAMTALTGCSSSSLDKNAVVATMNGDTTVTLGEAGFLMRYNQANTESYLGALFGGENMWEQDITGSGVAYGTTFKEEVMDQLKEMLILEQHMADYNVELSEEEQAAIKDAAAAFLANNDEEALESMFADEATVTRTLTLYTIQEKMRAAIEAGVDTNVTDEEAAQKTIEYAVFDTSGKEDEEGNVVDLTDEEKEAVKQQAQEVIDAVKGGEELEAAVKAIDENKTTLTYSYGEDDAVLSDALKEAADQLSDGEVYETPVEMDTGWYVVQMKSTFDKEATEDRKTEIISERENELYTETLAGWEPESFEIDAEIWDKVLLDVGYTVTRQTEAATEAAATEEAATESESTEEAATESESTEEAAAEETEAESAAEETEEVTETESAAEETEEVTETE